MTDSTTLLERFERRQIAQLAADVHRDTAQVHTAFAGQPAENLAGLTDRNAKLVVGFPG